MTAKLTMRGQDATAQARPTFCVCGHTNRDHHSDHEAVCDGMVPAVEPEDGSAPRVFLPCHCHGFAPVKPGDES